MGRLFLRQHQDINSLLEIVEENGLTLSREAVEYACKKLSDEWLSLFAFGGPNCIWDMPGGSYALPQWTALISSLFELRDVEGIDDSDIPFGQGQLICRDGVDTNVAEVMSIAAGD